jgi:hypothetical protein
LIFDELSEAKKILKNKDLEYFKISTLTILAKYFKYIGKSWKETEEELIKYCSSQNTIKFEVYDLEVISAIIKNAKKYLLRVPTMCCITEKELQEIETLNNFKTERVFFVMICLAKYFMETNTAIKPKIYENPKLIFWRGTSELFKEARYSNNFFDRNILIGDIQDKGYIETIPNEKRTKNSIVINTFYPESNPVIYFKNPDKIYKLYKAYKDDKLNRCEICSVSIIKNSNRQTMCEACSEEKRREQTRERVEKYRDNTT